jgi:hypothetical protein
MSEEVYTLGVWQVKPGAEEAFIAAWKELGGLFMSLPQPPGPGTLVQSIDQPQLLYSFGSWPSMEAIQAMRADPRVPEMIGKLSALCDEAKPGTFRVVATVP